MIFNYDKNREVVALLGAGSMGLSIVERIASNRIVLLGDISEKALAEAKEKLEYSGYAVDTMQVDASDKASIYAFARKAAELGPVMYFINTAGASPHQTNPQHIIDLDLVGSAHALDAFGNVMARGGAGILISFQFIYLYSLKSVGVAPRLFCTYRLKCDSDEKPNLSLMSVKLRLLSRSRRLISSDV